MAEQQTNATTNVTTPRVYVNAVGIVPMQSDAQNFVSVNVGEAFDNNTIDVRGMFMMHREVARQLLDQLNAYFENLEETE